MANSPTAPQQDKVPAAEPKESLGAFLFQIFCAVIFLGMIGLVSYNTLLRYAFGSSFPPSEEWSRFLFTYITFFGAIEAFYYHKHIAVDLVIEHLHGMPRKIVDIIAIFFSLGTMTVLLLGGIEFVEQTCDELSTATHINLALVNCVLPICAGVAILCFLRDLIKTIRTPAALINPEMTKEEKIAKVLKENM